MVYSLVCLSPVKCQMTVIYAQNTVIVCVLVLCKYICHYTVCVDVIH